MDTLIVYNRNNHAADPAWTDWIMSCEELLCQAEGQATRRGQIRLLVRENVGLSFGGYNHAFTLLAEQYDYWLFTEDDHVLIQDGYLSQAIEQMESNPNVGFVAMVGVSTKRKHPPHAHGGVGVSSRRILNEVRYTHRCPQHPGGQLPYHVGQGYENQERLAEIPFTNAIYSLGYQLVNVDLEDVCLDWGATTKRTPRMVVSSDGLRRRTGPEPKSATTPITPIM